MQVLRYAEHKAFFFVSDLFTAILVHIMMMASAIVQPVPQPRNVEPVEVLVEKGITKIPDMYVRPPHQRAQIPINPPSLEVPVIDLQGLNCDGMERENTMKQLAKACEEWGFFQIVNHGVPLSLMDSMMVVAREFFALPVEEKQSYSALPGKVLQSGYGSKYANQDDATRDWRDFIFLFVHPHYRRTDSKWPRRPALFRETVDKYCEEVRKVAQRLLAAFSVNLGLPSRCLEEALGEPHQNILINYYPPCPQPELASGFHAHSDLGAVTVLLQESGSTALHVRHKGLWIPVKALPGALLVNVADQVEILTNGIYKSIEHRVVVEKHKTRISIPVFFEPSTNTVIKPAPQLLRAHKAAADADDEKVEDGDGEKYKSIVFTDHETAFYTFGPDGKKYVQSYIINT